MTEPNLDDYLIFTNRTPKEIFDHALAIVEWAGLNNFRFYRIAGLTSPAEYERALCGGVSADDVRWLLRQVGHNEFSHDYIKDEKRCDVCRRIKRIAKQLSTVPRRVA